MSPIEAGAGGTQFWLPPYGHEEYKSAYTCIKKYVLEDKPSLDCAAKTSTIFKRWLGAAVGHAFLAVVGLFLALFYDFFACLGFLGWALHNAFKYGKDAALEKLDRAGNHFGSIFLNLLEAMRNGGTAALAFFTGGLLTPCVYQSISPPSLVQKVS